MFCAFAGPPKIVRLHGTGNTVYPTDAAFDKLLAHFHDHVAARAIIEVTVTRISDSCGFGVPLMSYVGERDLLDRWAEAKGSDGLREYRNDKNRQSIDGNKGYNMPNHSPDPRTASVTPAAGQLPRQP
jgi:hypothetical protein